MLAIVPQPPDGALLLKDGICIGRAALRGNVLETFCVEPPFRRRGYGTWFFRQLLRRHAAASGSALRACAAPGDEAAAAFLGKFGFSSCGDGVFCRRLPAQVNAVSVAHDFIRARLRPGGFAIDATAGNGHDTAFLCRVVGPAGHVLALDIQPAAVQATRARLQREGLAQGRVVCANHACLAQLAAPGTANAVMFNLGYLPGGDHSLFTVPEESVPALDAALALLRPGGALTVCAYSGAVQGSAPAGGGARPGSAVQGTRERDAVLGWADRLDDGRFGVYRELFSQRTGFPPVAVCVEKRL